MSKIVYLKTYHMEAFTISKGIAEYAKVKHHAIQSMKQVTIEYGYWEYNLCASIV